VSRTQSRATTDTQAGKHLATIERFSASLGAADYESFLALWSETGVFEMPFPVDL
jgi:hypothetical protein